MSKRIYLLKEFIYNKDISDEGLCVLSALRSIMTQDKTEYFVSYNMLADIIYERIPNKREYSLLKSGMNNLINLNLVSILIQYSNGDGRYDLSKLYLNSDNSKYYVDISDEELINIFKLDTSISKYKLYRYFIYMIGTFNHSTLINKQYRGRFGGLSLQQFSHEISYSIRTIINYNTILEKNQLLYIVRHKDYLMFNPDEDNKVKELPNSYCRYQDKDLLLEFLTKTNNNLYSSTAKKKKSNEANKKRGLAQKYLAFCNGKQYDKKTIKDLIGYCAEWNKEQKGIYEKAIKDGYSPTEPEYKDTENLLKILNEKRNN